MKKPNFLKKFTFIDILIIICIICAIGFAIFHIVDDSPNTQSATSFDSSTTNKILEKYLDYYKDGNIVKSKIVGTNASSREEVNIEGTVIWIGEDENNKINILIDANGEKILTGLYKDIPNADIYFDKISLESDGNHYKNVKDLTLAPQEISNLNELVSKIPNETKYEISTTVTTDLNNFEIQKLTNSLSLNKRLSIVPSEIYNNKLLINRANNEDIKIAASTINNFKGQSSEIHIRLYDCTEDELKTIKNSYKILNIADIS